MLTSLFAPSLRQQLMLFLWFYRALLSAQSTNVLYYQCRSLIGYATQYLFCCR